MKNVGIPTSKGLISLDCIALDLEQMTSSSVEIIINSLAELEKDIDNINSKVEEMKKRILIYSNEEIEMLKQQVINIANEEAEKILSRSKAEAEEESRLIIQEADSSLSEIKKNIDSSFNSAVDSIVKTVLGETMSTAKQSRYNNP
jgi:V/A-type H+/Na+-transporting ATPase subunit G/H